MGLASSPSYAYPLASAGRRSGTAASLGAARVLAVSRTRGARALHTYGAIVRPTDRRGRCGVSCIGWWSAAV